MRILIDSGKSTRSASCSPSSPQPLSHGMGWHSEVCEPHWHPWFSYLRWLFFCSCFLYSRHFSFLCLWHHFLRLFFHFLHSGICFSFHFFSFVYLFFWSLSFQLAAEWYLSHVTPLSSSIQSLNQTFIVFLLLSGLILPMLFLYNHRIHVEHFRRPFIPNSPQIPILRVKMTSPKRSSGVSEFEWNNEITKWKCRRRLTRCKIDGEGSR